MRRPGAPGKTLPGTDNLQRIEAGEGILEGIQKNSPNSQRAT